ncbi:MAG: peptidoglycan editing factor PgeF [Deltaproteobacteria bacterium]|nr:peptidoglycan editing factor PgeF [Deltaproteobacteria bacterium]
MISQSIDSLQVWFFENLLGHGGIGHFVSTRVGGHSTSPYDSLNLSFNAGDDPENVRKNRERLVEAIGIPLNSVTTAKQIHDDCVKVVSEELRGRGSVDYDGAINGTDAMVTNVPNTCLMILMADCVPLLFYDPSKEVIGVAHAGWKGTLGFIAQATIKTLQEHFGSSTQDIFVGIGPSVGPCCYQVGQEVVSQVEQVFGTKQHFVINRSGDGKGYLDLWEANLKQLIDVGIPEENIEIARTCTCHHRDVFFSYRYERGKTGRFGAGIFIR